MPTKRALPPSLTVTAVIPTYKSTAERLNKCIQAAIEQVDELLIIVDQSTILPPGVVMASKVRYLLMPGVDAGFSQKANYGIANARCNWIWLLNDDCYAQPDNVIQMMRAAKRKTAVVGHLLRYPNGLIQHGGTTRGPGQIGWTHLDQGAFAPTINAPKEVECVTFASVLINKTAWDIVGGLCEEFQFYCEDWDFCLRVRQLGWNVWYTPLTWATHEEHTSSRQRPNVKDIANASMATFTKKWEKYFKANTKLDHLGYFDYKADFTKPLPYTPPPPPPKAKPDSLSIYVVYIFPATSGSIHVAYANRFIASYLQHPPELEHQTVIILNGAKRTEKLEKMFVPLPNVHFLEHDDSGWDIGGYQLAARTYPDCDLMVFLGGSTYFKGKGWLKRIAESFISHGQAIYGVMGNRGDLGVKVWPHIRTTGFWMNPKLLNQYPVQVTQKDQRYLFEHGKNCLTEWLKAKGIKAFVVSWDGEYEWAQWDSIKNGFHQGDQSNLLMGDRLTEPPAYHTA